MCDLEHPFLICVNHSMFPDSTVYYLLAGTLLEAAGLEPLALLLYHSMAVCVFQSALFLGGCQTLKVRTEY